MGRTSRRRTSAADAENTSTRRSSRHSKAAAAVVANSSPPPPEPSTGKVLNDEKSTKNVEPVKNGDRAPEDVGDNREKQSNSNDVKNNTSAGKQDEVEEKEQDDEDKQQPSGRARSRSRSKSVEVNTNAPVVRRSRRLSRGSSVEPSDDEGGHKNAVSSKSSGETGLQTIQEQGESPEKRRSLGESSSLEKLGDGKEKENKVPSWQSEQLEKEEADKETSLNVQNIKEDDSVASTDADNPQGNSGIGKIDVEDSQPASEETRQPPNSEEAKQNTDVDDESVKDEKLFHNKDDDVNEKEGEEGADRDDGDGVDTVKLTLETGETLDKFDDTDEEEVASASATPAKQRSPEKIKRRSRSPRNKRRRSSSSSSSDSGSRRRHHRRREEVSSSRSAKKEDDRSPRKSSSNKKSSHRDSEFSSPVKNGSDKQLSDSRARSPGSASKKRHSLIVLRGLADQGDDHDDRRAAKHSRKSSSHRQQSEEKDTAFKKEEEPVDDFDYSSFKSSRRVSLSKKLRDPDNKARKTSAAATATSLKSSEPSIELSSQSLKGLLPDVHPVPESEFKLEEDEEDHGEGEEKKKNLGSLSDSELRERKLLLQKKLQGLEEKERQEKKQFSGNSEKVPKKTGDTEEVTFSDPEEEERALRKAAQESMKAKLAKKEELARRLDGEDDELLPEKKKVKKERDVREGSPICKKIKEGREVRVVEGPAVVVRKTPSIAPARNPTSCVVIIKNLTRPFTLRQLQTLLQRTGRIVQPDGFWVDNVKSVCVARFENEDQAEETRMHLHGIQWPSSNPKTLFVDFTTQEDLERRLKESGAPVLPQPQDQLRRKTSAATVREWDRVKLGERSPGEREREKELQKRRREEGDVGGEGETTKRADQRSEGRIRGRSRDWDDERHNRDRKVVKKEVASAPPEKPTPKSLDDLFNKTKAKPSIYWLPLNKEQIAEKEAMRRKLMAENEKQLAALKLKHEKEREEREKQRQEREKQREAEKKERAAAAAKKKKSRSRSRSRKRSPKRSSRSRRRSRS